MSMHLAVTGSPDPIKWGEPKIRGEDCPILDHFQSRSPSFSTSPPRTEASNLTPSIDRRDEGLSPIDEDVISRVGGAAVRPQPLPPPLALEERRSTVPLGQELEKIVYPIIEFCNRHVRHLEASTQSVLWPSDQTTALWDKACDIYCQPFQVIPVEERITKRAFEGKIRAWRRCLHQVDWIRQFIFVPPSELVTQFMKLQKEVSNFAKLHFPSSLESAELPEPGAADDLKNRINGDNSPVQRFQRQHVPSSFESAEVQDPAVGDDEKNRINGDNSPTQRFQRQKQLLFGMATEKFRDYVQYILSTEKAVGSDTLQPRRELTYHQEDRQISDLLERITIVNIDIQQLWEICHQITRFLTRNIPQRIKPIVIPKQLKKCRSCGELTEEVIKLAASVLFRSVFEEKKFNKDHYLVRQFTELLGEAKPIAERFRDIGTDKGLLDNSPDREVIRLQVLTLRYFLTPRATDYFKWILSKQGTV